jgi:hypothetical protein
VLYLAVLVGGAHQGLTFVPEGRGLGGLLGGVVVGVQVQHPRLGQQRPREAEQEQQG